MNQSVDINVDINNEKQNRKKSKIRESSSYKNRFLTVLPVSFCLSFTVFLFGPCELTWSDSVSLTFSVGDVVCWMGIFSFIFCFLLTFLISFFKKATVDSLVSVVLGIAVAAYIEGAFSSSFLGLLDGDSVAWQDKVLTMLLDLTMWIAVIAAVFLIKRYFNKIWKLFLRFVPLVLIVMQIAGLSLIVFESAKDDNTKYYLNSSEIYDFSSQKNILVFVLDRLDYDYVEQVKANDPEFFDELDGFTCYSNAMSVFGRTNPAASFILAGDEENAYKIPRFEYYDKQWEGENLLQKLDDSGCRVNLYGNTTGLIGSGKNVKDSVRNISDSRGKINPGRLIGNLNRLTLYRYAPFIFKPFFWCYTGQMNDGVYPSLEINQTAFNKAEYELSTDSGDTYFKFYHFIGSHPPYTLNEDGTESGETTDLISQTKGCFRIVYNILNEMKEKKIYENSSIIILADHGWAVDDSAELQRATTIGLFYKPSGSAGVPIKYSEAPVSHRNIPATILKEAGVETDGVSLDEVKENDNAARLYYKSVVSGNHENYVAVYSVQGNANVFKNWRKVSEFPVKGYFY